MKRYGHVEEDGYPLAAWIWGHRLRIGQHWMEYLLEFLNVLAGFDYELGQGLTEDVAEPSPKTEYTLFTRLGLRRFVFYDEWEKTRHPFDTHACRLMQEALQNQIILSDEENSQGALMLARLLLRAFSAVEEQRSWYAKSLFPAHHYLLFWEALRKGATKYKDRREAERTQARELDAEIAFDSRNFFARGGEIYYLILSAGTQNMPDQRHFIVSRLAELLTARNQALGRLAKTIDEIWQQLTRQSPESGNENEWEKKGRLGWIPDPDCPLYVTIAEDVATFLQANLDSLETLDLLAHLIGFHLSLYIYHRAHPDATAERHAESVCCDTCRPMLLVDVMGGADGGILRDISSALFREQEARIVQKGRDYVARQVQAWAQDPTRDEVFARAIVEQAEAYFNLTGLDEDKSQKDKPAHKSQKDKSAYKSRRDRLIEKLSRDEIDQAAFIADYADLLTNLLMGDFRKNFLGVHRKLAKSVGLVAPRKGPGARFVLGDNLLKALTLANLSPSPELTYDDFLERLYLRYGLVVGPDEAQRCGLFERQRIDTEYYNRNKAALLEKIQHAGLAVEYSDATAMVTSTAHRLSRTEKVL